MGKLSGYFFLTCAFTLAGTSVISARLISGSVGTFTATGVSLFFALLILLPLCLKKIVPAVRAMSAGDWVYTGLQALFGIFLFRLLLLQGLLRTSTAEAGILTGATPAITAILARGWLKERIQAKNVAGIFSTIVGIALIQGLLSRTLSLAHLMGNLLVLGAAASESVFNALSRKSALRGEPKKTFDPIVQTTLVALFALLFCLLPALFEQPAQRLSALNISGWLALIWYGWLGTSLAFICWYAGIKRCPAHVAAAFSGMMPSTSLLLSAVLLREPVAWHQWVGAALVISGMVLIGIQTKKRRRITAQAELPVLPEAPNRCPPAG